MQGDQQAAVKAGIFVLVGLVLMAAVIIVLGQRSQLFASRYTLKVTFKDAQGLIPGAPVRLAGVTVGSVRSVELVSGTKESGEVEVTLGIQTRHQEKIRADSKASILSLGLLGDKYVEITLGSFEKPVLNPGEAVDPEPTVDVYRKAAEAFAELDKSAGKVGRTFDKIDEESIVPELSEAVKKLAAMLAKAEERGGLIYAFLDDEMSKNLKTTSKVIEASARRVAAGQGALGELVYGEKLLEGLRGFADVAKKANSILGEFKSDVHGKQLTDAIRNLAEASEKAKSILKEIDEGKGLVHELIYGEDGKKSLKRLDETVARLSELLDWLRKSEGTLALLIEDAEVWERIKRILGGAEESAVLKMLIHESTFPEGEPQPAEENGKK